mmetsp:Transcript_19112/g.60117  ORF Transcript_19112/g.60117 Transcript_19112/m.60117 type:complete len:151 (-) Transcript_19112:207-659(-)
MTLPAMRPSALPRGLSMGSAPSRSLPRCRLAPGAVTFSAAVGAWVQVGRAQCAIALTAALLRSRVAPNVFSCGAAVSDCGKKAGQWQAALAHFAAMPRNVFIYNADVRACEKVSQWRSAFALFAETPRSRLVIDVITCSAVLGPFEKAGQ